VFGDRHVIVMVSVTEETPYLSGLLATVTVMTLMTLIYGLILDEGMRLYFVGSLTVSTYPTYPTRRTRSPVPMRFFNLRLVSGFLKLPDNPTPPPD
jgi:hypothetical protein